MKTKILIISIVIALTLTSLSVSNKVHAAMVSTDDIAAQARSDFGRDRLIDALEREEVQRKLVALGVDLAHARSRIAAMTDREIAALQQNIDDLPAGAGPGGVLLTVLLVLVILDIIGVTNIFTFIN